MSQRDEPTEPSTVATRPSYHRVLSQNELSYFLPSRAFGLNDMFLHLIVRAPPGLLSPLRLRMVWAILRLRHTLLACQIQMDPGCYDEAQFKYTPPASPSEAVEEAGDTVRVYDDKTGPELVEAFINPTSPRKLSSRRIACIDVAKHGEVSPGIEEYHIIVMTIHAVTDGVSVHRHGNIILELLCGSSTPGGPPRTDAELAYLLDLEWKMRWAQPRVGEVIVPATEDRLPSPRSKFQMAAWTVDHQNLEKRAIGGHVLPRLKNQTCKQVIEQKYFDVQETSAILAKCKEQRTTLANASFALCNFAWIRTAQNHPEFYASKSLPMMFYTAVSLRRHLPLAPLSSYTSLALTYCNIVLPSFIPRSVDPRAMFWLRARSAQSQMSIFCRSPLISARSHIMSAKRGLRAKAFAKQDDEDDGMPQQKPIQAPSPGASTVPSVALMGISFLGDLDQIYRTDRYPSAQLVNSFGQVRKAPGGIMLFTQMLHGEFSVALGWDVAAFPPGVIEEFLDNFADSVREYILGFSSDMSTKL
ncbi:hypothetical protein DFH07DRAFT_400696 [Mycena maculata]|uniref:Uncharacterized protein n=1 Tax=Mycena maculata TaxID=230809 RepID=A0AAD7H6T1_9AGAR|nr:hypothetical protein DFH07DRAFT_400696 [Mycena maculata]